MSILGGAVGGVNLYCNSIIAKLWKQAYAEGSVKVCYTEGSWAINKKNADVLQAALINFRTVTKRRKVREYELYLKISSCTVKRDASNTILLVRRKAKEIYRVGVILDLLTKLPHFDTIQEELTVEDFITPRK